MLYLFFVWCAMAAVVISLYLYRKLVTRSEDDLVHLGDADEVLVNKQKAVATRLQKIDQLERILMVVTVVLGLIVAGLYLYHGWNTSGQMQ